MRYEHNFSHVRSSSTPNKNLDNVRKGLGYYYGLLMKYYDQYYDQYYIKLKVKYLELFSFTGWGLSWLFRFNLFN